MMKLYRVLLFVLLTLVCLTSFAAAADSPRLVDEADLLADYEETILVGILDEISERQRLDVVVVTASTLDGKTPMAYADDYFDYNGYGFGASRDGVLLLVCMEDRDWWISTSGYGITAFTDAGISYLSDAFLGDLSDGLYLNAFATFAEQCDYYITEAKAGYPIDVDNYVDEEFDPAFCLILSAVPALIIAFIVMSVMKGQLKSVQQQNAGAYIKDGGLNLTESREMFLYRNVTRTVRQSESSGGSSTHTSSSGRSHGGGGGKF